MSSIQIDIQDFRSRVVVVRELLRPLCQKDVACDIRTPKTTSGKVIVAHGTQKSARRGLVAAHVRSTEGVEYDNVMFPSRARTIRCRYFEFWKPEGGGQLLRLDKSYLTLMKKNETAHRYDEILAIHCDPNNSCPGLLRDFKRGPHLHLSMLEDPLPKCHFPLNFGELDHVLGSLDALTRALGDAVRIISQEVLVRYR
jgi:hypothetical protein